MVSSLNFIRVIAAICHIERDVPVDKYLFAYKTQKVKTMHSQQKENNESHFNILQGDVTSSLLISVLSFIHFFVIC